MPLPRCPMDFPREENTSEDLYPFVFQTRNQGYRMDFQLLNNIWRHPDRLLQPVIVTFHSRGCLFLPRCFSTPKGPFLTKSSLD